MFQQKREKMCVLWGVGEDRARAKARRKGRNMNIGFHETLIKTPNQQGKEIFRQISYHVLNPDNLGKILLPNFNNVTTNHKGKDCLHRT